LHCPYVKIAGIGSYLPDRVVLNQELAETLDTSDEWIVSHTGISKRHIASPDQACSDLAHQASSKALESAGLQAEELGLIIVATSSGDYYNFPSTACLLQHKLGARNAAAFDLGAACSGFVYSLEMARSWVLSQQKPALIVGCELLSRIVDWQDRETCVLFGDGAGAAVLVPSEENGIPFSYLAADGENFNLLKIDSGCRISRSGPERQLGYLQMLGKPVFNFAVRSLENVINIILQKNSLTIDDITYIVPHQANLRILELVAKRMEIPSQKFYNNINEVANTSAASIPLVLDELQRERKIHPGDLIITVTFGAGLTYGGNLLRWQI
jgi:3-oxoacyl-[acyl-carrier-protein] synthase-3